MTRTIKDYSLLLPVGGGVLALLRILLDRSEAKNSLIPGLSLFRLSIAAAALLVTGFSLLLFQYRSRKLRFLYPIIGPAALLSAEVLLFARVPSDDTRNFIPLIASRGKPIFLLLLLCALCWLTALNVSGEKAPRNYGFFLLITAVLIYWGISSHIDRYDWRIDLQGNGTLCLLTTAAALIWCLALGSGAELGWKTAAGSLFFLILGFAVTRSTGMWMGRTETPAKAAYWNELAEAFLNGRLYLEHPSGTHDLTLYNGKWYVPNPPLPGILLIPWVAVLGSAEKINMSVYSSLTAGINTGLCFLMLILAFTRPGSPLRVSGADHSVYPGSSLSIACWVTVLFTFGTDHLWLGTTGQMWFISQLLVVTFTLLAVIFVIGRCSPVFAGIALALGVLCRPNIFPVYLCLLGIRLGQEREFPRLNWKKSIRWCLLSGIPVVLAAGCLLGYNKLRFGSWMDFGYVTINGADWILDSVQKYGMFHPHFLKINANAMLFGLPELDFSGERFFFQPHLAGYSIFLMTPPLIYVFRSFRKNWFEVGAWASVLVSIALLLLYHNTGAEQIGYRYLLDITAPLALLTADGMRGKVSLLFKFLTIFAVILSFIAITWWYLGRV